MRRKTHWGIWHMRWTSRARPSIHADIRVSHDICQHIGTDSMFSRLAQPHRIVYSTLVTEPRVSHGRNRPTPARTAISGTGWTKFSGQLHGQSTPHHGDAGKYPAKREFEQQAPRQHGIDVVCQRRRNSGRRFGRRLYLHAVRGDPTGHHRILSGV